MGFWKRLKFWDTQAVIETTIETTQGTFREEKRKHPDRDPHAWLALTYGSRGGYSPIPLFPSPVPRFIRCSGTMLLPVWPTTS